jgi:hypothetical protein
VARGVDLLNGSSASFHGCSFESFRASGLALYGGASATLSGCYFEGEPESGDHGFGVIVANNGHVTAIGNHVYLTNLNQRFITVEGGSTTGTRVFSRGNRFIYPTDTQAVDVYTPVATDATSTWDVSGDNWQSDAGANCHYLELTFEGAVAFGTGQYRITYPANHPLAQAPIDTVRPYSSIGAVASAGTLAIPVGARVVTVSGTTGITSITATGHTGRTVTLVFAGILTVTDGSNLRLNGDFTTSADDTLTLVCDGTNWYEVARSAN